MPASHPLSACLQRQTRCLERQLQPALDGEVEPLHRARVATRRLRELLPLCAPAVPRGLVTRARRRVRRVGRSLGAVREIDVAAQLLVELADGGRLSSAGARRFARYLADERHGRRRRLIARVRSVSPRKALRDLAEVVKVLEVGRASLDAWPLALARRLGGRSRRLNEAVVAAGALYAPERVHGVRIAAKKLRYGLEIAVESRTLDGSPAIARLKAIQDTLGRLHDLEVLTGFIQTGLLACDPRQRGVGDLDALRAALAGDCRMLHAEFVAAQSELINVCDVARRAALRIWTDHGGDRGDARVLKMSLAGTVASAASGGHRPL